jgi:transposase
MVNPTAERRITVLNVEERFMIKDLYRKGVSICDIARLTGHDRKTVRKMLQETVVPSPATRQAKARKIDPYTPYLQQRIAEGVLNARKLYGEILGQGYAGKESRVRDFVHPFRQARQPQATVRFETEPGQQGQVDWGYFGAIQHDGRQRRLYGFVMTLGWSRMMYLEFTVSTNETTFLRCHIHAFRYFDGIPRQLLHDNLKTAVLARAPDGAIRWHPRYLDFADYYGFTPRACRPYRAQTKGKVESGVKYVRGNFWPGLKFTDLADLNLQALDWLDRVANVRVHGTTGEMPAARFPLENLQSLVGKPDYDTSVISARRSSRDCLVSYLGNYYSVPAAFARQHLIVLSQQGEEVARHRLACGRNQRIIVAAHYQGISTTSQLPIRAGAVQLALPESVLFPLGPAPVVEARPLSAYDACVEVVA